MNLLNLLIGFLKVGLFAFGGGYAAVPLIRDVVLSYGWLDPDMLTHMIAVSESTPGPIMINLATYVGSTQGGIIGALIATLAVILPSFIIILIIVKMEKKLLKNQYVQAALSGIKPCVIGIIGATGVYMILQHVFTAFPGGTADTTAMMITVVLAVIYFGSGKMTKRGISPVLLIGIAALAGVLVYGI
jgi:chromate transporter